MANGLSVQPLTPALWPALEELFDGGGSCQRCWCMYWRVGSSYRQRPVEANRADLHAIVRQGPPPGLLAFEDGRVVGWCQLTPRDGLPRLDRTAALARVDESPVWCLSCFYVRKGFRKRGVTVALIREALRVAREAGAPAVEAYPLDAEHTTSSSFTGFASTFARLGFTEVARRVPSRPIVRYSFE